MKKYLLLFSIASSLYCFSQSDFRFANPAAQWNVLSTYYCMAGPCQYYNTLVHECGSDTLMDGKYYQGIYVERDTSWFNMTDLGDQVFLRKDSSGKVFIRRYADSLDYLIYNFSLQGGETFTIENPYPWNISYCHVDSVDTVLLDVPRKRMYVRYNGNWHQDIWIEGIGSVKSHFLQPGANFIVSDGAEYEMLCFSENSKRIYRHAAYQTCFLDSNWSSIDEPGQIAFSLSPNPATDNLIVQLEEFPSWSTAMQLFDITGRMVLQKPLTGTSNQIDLHEVSKGMYLYNVVSERGKAGAGKLVVE